jgi:putative transposase
VPGIVTNKDQKMLAINGLPDHIHIFIAMIPNCCLSDLVREIKKASNLYINEKNYVLPNFNGNKDLAHFHIANPVYGM